MDRKRRIEIHIVRYLYIYNERETNREITMRIEKTNLLRYTYNEIN